MTNNFPHVNRRVSSKSRAKPWPRTANEARVESIGHAMDGLVLLKDAQQQIKTARQAVNKRDTTLTLLHLAELEATLARMELHLTHITNALDNVPTAEGGDD